MEEVEEEEADQAGEDELEEDLVAFINREMHTNKGKREEQLTTRV